jgi:hypothetical protein
MVGHAGGRLVSARQTAVATLICDHKCYVHAQNSIRNPGAPKSVESATCATTNSRTA